MSSLDSERHSVSKFSRDFYALAVGFLKVQDSFLTEDRFGVKARWNRAFTRMDALKEFDKSGIVPKFNLSSHSIRDELRVECWLNVLMLRRSHDHHRSRSSGPESRLRSGFIAGSFHL
jgi:hypothetical protein